MRCLSVLLRLDQLRTGELHNTEGGEMKEHFSTCPTCHDSYDEIERFADEVRGLLEVSEDATPSTVDGFDRITTPAGDTWVAFSERGLRMISTLPMTEEELREEYSSTFGRCLRRDSLPESMKQQVVAAIAGEPFEGASVDLTGLPTFEQKVLTAISAIPHGEVRTYTWVARAIGQPKAVRAVGNALAKNPIAPVVPCHRVVPASGGIGNYALGAARKRELLRREGVEVSELDDLARSGIRFLGNAGVYCHPTCSRIRSARREWRIPFHSEAEAALRGFEPCDRCSGLARSA
jgi:methylated-DNA-[protein]-cysteine S-methyltransferase